MHVVGKNGSTVFCATPGNHPVVAATGIGFSLRVDPHVRVIQGDGMTVDSIGRLVQRMIEEGFAIDNIAFGMGGGMLQHVNRDTLRFAMKANAMLGSDGVWHDVFKMPSTDPGKASKAGRQAVVLKDGRMAAARFDSVAAGEDMLVPVWRNGELLVRHDFDAVRKRSEGR